MRLTPAIVAAMMLATLGTAYAEVSYRQYNGDTYGSDGSRSHEFNGTTTISKPGRQDVHCHEFSGKTYCD